MASPSDVRPSVQSYDTVVSKVEDLTPGVRGLLLQLPAGASIRFRAGQYILTFITTPDGKNRRTPYSIASEPQMTDKLELCITLVPGGVSSSFLHKLEVGNILRVLGPIGTFTMPATPVRDVVFVATGSGVAPFHSMIKDLLARGVTEKIYLVYGNRFVHDVIYRQEWEALERAHPNFKALFTLSKPDETWTGETGYVQDMLAKFVPDLPLKDFYICGLERMIDGVCTRLNAAGVPKEQIHFERYD